MSGTTIVASSFLAGAMVLGADIAISQTYPVKPVRIVAAEVGGTGDVLARMVAEGLSGSLGQQVIVDNRGGNVIGPAQIVAKALPDGYTTILYGSSFWLVPLMREHTPYDAVKDFSAISSVAKTMIILLVHPSLPVKSVKDLIALAKARPGELNYAAGTVGAISHLAGKLFKAMASVEITDINFKGEGPAFVALVGGQVQVSFLTAGVVAPMIKAGKLNALAITSAEPSALFPGVPTVAASGLPGYEAAILYGMLAPAGTPAPVVNRLSAETARFLQKADVKEKLLGLGIESTGSTPAEFAATIKSDMTRMGKVIKDAGIRID